LERTVDWYLANGDWLEEVTSGAYRDFYERQYGSR
jgi:dTDP-glucose 4,6-dehydratase